MGFAFCVAHAQWAKIYQTDTGFLNRRFPIQGMAFFGPDSGVVLSDRMGITTNSGDTWNYNSDSTKVYGHFSATDTKHVWLGFGQTIFRTNDAGNTWELDSNVDSASSMVISIYFIDSLNGVEGGNGMMMYRTSDGGKNWQLVHHSETDIGYGIGNIAFANSKVGIATTNDIGTWVLITSDGGLTWKITGDVHSAVANSSNCLSYPDPRNAYFFTWYGALFHSGDSGKTWQETSSIEPIGGYISQVVQSLSFIDSLHGIAAGRNPSSDSLAFSYTSDGGLTWRTEWIDSANGGSSAICFTSFPDTSVAYAAGTNTVFRIRTADLAVAPSPQTSQVARFENDFGNLFINLPQNQAGRLRIMDELGRVLEERALSPGSRNEINGSTNSPPHFRFAEVECNGRIQVFKLLE